MIRCFAKSIIFLSAIWLTVQPVMAQDSIEDVIAKRIKKTSEKDFISVSVENDSLGGGTDQFYTSGVRLTWFNVSTPVPPVIDEMAEMVPTFDINATTSTFFTLGQNIYTPEDITLRANQDDDRPWAGFLYGSVGLATLENNHIDELELTLGVVGPESLGEEAQRFVHKNFTDSPSPKGWDNQLDFEPALIISAQRRWPRFYRKEMGAVDFNVEPNVQLSLGNVYTNAGAGVSFTLGQNDGTLQDKPPRVRPAMPGSGFFETPEHGFGWIFFAGVDGRAVARDIFLDGNSFKDSHSVDKKPFVADASAGVALTYDRYRLSYSINARTKEFDGQEDGAVFGSVTLGLRF